MDEANMNHFEKTAMREQTQWIRIPMEELKRKQIFHGDLGGRFAYFRCENTLPANVRLTAQITAVSRYRLWVNGTPVLSGPCKGDLNRQYFETVELTPYLRTGKNVFAVQVLYNDPDIARDQTDERAAIYGVAGAGNCHALAVSGEITDAAGQSVASITTGQADWRVWLDDSFYLRSTQYSVYLGAVEERIDFRLSPADWRAADFDISAWLTALPYGPVIPSALFQGVGLVPRVHVIPREIPLLYEKETAFARIIPRENDVVLDAGVHVNGYPRFTFSGRVGTEITITYLERFGDGGDGRRIDDLNGSVSGRADHIILNGQPLCYEPFWVRTFRYIVIRSSEGALPRMPAAPVYRQTGYPLPVASRVASGAPWVERVWDMCLRTLQNCMLETYMDCPYYEQLQFIMDTRLQMLFTYAVSNDTRLAKKALLDFHCGMLPEGLLPGKTPAAYCQVISTFSLHYVFALWEYLEHTGDAALARRYRPDVDRILDYYDGMRDASGLVAQIRPWAFIDWQDDWKETGGVPPAYFEGPSAIINLMYAYALECAAKLYGATGRPGTAEEYRQRREDILHRVKTLCFDQEKGMVREGPACRQFTRHAQAWAVINGLMDQEESKRALQAAVACPPCSFAASFEWFRALEKAGMEEQMRRELDAWIGLLDRGSSTCPEEPHHPRSECHAWSALPLYEFMRTLAGIRQENGKIVIRPRLFDLPDLSGEAITPLGTARFHYHRSRGGAWRYEISLPENVPGVLITPEGKEISFTKKYVFSRQDEPGGATNIHEARD